MSTLFRFAAFIVKSFWLCEFYHKISWLWLCQLLCKLSLTLSTLSNGVNRRHTTAAGEAQPPLLKHSSWVTAIWAIGFLLVRFPNPLAPGSDIQIQVSWGTRLLAMGQQEKTFPDDWLKTQSRIEIAMKDTALTAVDEKREKDKCENAPGRDVSPLWWL